MGTLKATIEQTGPATSTATIRTHTVLVDRTVANGGLDSAPAGGEYLAVALGGCFTSHLLGAIRAREAPMSNVRVHVTATTGGTPERFTAFTLDVTAECADAQLARKIVTIAGRGCQVVNTLAPVAPITFTYDGSPVVVGDVAAVA
ncbi:MAG: OsmC family protein [Gemmatimonadaceae bacterium]